MADPLDEIDDLSHHVNEPKHSLEQAHHPLPRTVACPTPDYLIGVIKHFCSPLLDPSTGCRRSRLQEEKREVLLNSYVGPPGSPGGPPSPPAGPCRGQAVEDSHPPRAYRSRPKVQRGLSEPDLRLANQYRVDRRPLWAIQYRPKRFFKLF